MGRQVPDLALSFLCISLLPGSVRLIRRSACPGLEFYLIGMGCQAPPPADTPIPPYEVLLQAFPVTGLGGTMSSTKQQPLPPTHMPVEGKEIAPLSPPSHGMK